MPLKKNLYAMIGKHYLKNTNLHATKFNNIIYIMNNKRILVVNNFIFDNASDLLSL